MKKSLLLTGALIFSTTLIAPHAVAATKTCATTQSVEEGPYYLSNTPTRSDVTDGQSGKSIPHVSRSRMRGLIFGTPMHKVFIRV
jgi:hypothetical protein